MDRRWTLAPFCLMPCVAAMGVPPVGFWRLSSPLVDVSPLAAGALAAFALWSGTHSLRPGPQLPLRPPKVLGPADHPRVEPEVSLPKDQTPIEWPPKVLGPADHPRVEPGVSLPKDQTPIVWLPRAVGPADHPRVEPVVSLPKDFCRVCERLWPSTGTAVPPCRWPWPLARLRF